MFLPSGPQDRELSIDDALNVKQTYKADTSECHSDFSFCDVTFVFLQPQIQLSNNKTLRQPRFLDGQTLVRKKANQEMLSG